MLCDDYQYSSAALNEITLVEYFSYVVKASSYTDSQLTTLLYQKNNIGIVWFVKAAVGVFSAFGLVIYSRWIISARSSLTVQKKALVD
jgi:hypothetical protein